MPAGVEMFRKNKGKVGEVVVTDEDARIINEVLTPYWAGKDYASNFVQQPARGDAVHAAGPGSQEHRSCYTCVILATSPMRHSQNWTPDFTKILDPRREGHPRGGAGEARRADRSARRRSTKKPFLDAVVITCDAMTIWSTPLRRRGARARRQGQRPGAREGTARDRRGLRMGSREPGADLPRGDPGAMVGPALQPHRADQQRHGPGPHGPVPAGPTTRRTSTKAGSPRSRRSSCSIACGSTCRR